jgi:TonB family protein
MLRERLAAIAGTLLLIGCPWAADGKDSPRFDPARVVSIAQTIYPDGGTVSGTVILEAMVGRSGRVGTIQVVQGLPKLTEAAERSVRQWKFEPARLDRRPVTTPVLVAFTFSLGLPCSGPVRRSARRREPSPYEPVRILAAAPAANPAPDVAFGTATLQVMIGTTGTLGKVEVIDGIPPLAEEAERSVRQWKFQPAKFEGTPLATPMVASFVFSDLPPGQCSRF